MVPVKKQGPFEVFSRGVEEPWAVYKDGVPFKQVWTWQEVEAILRGGASTQPDPTRDLKAGEIRAEALAPKKHISFEIRGTNRIAFDKPRDTLIQRSRSRAAAEKARSRWASRKGEFANVRIVEIKR
jgi:hypothetical protein